MDLMARDNMVYVILVASIGVVIAVLVIAAIAEQNKRSKMNPDERRKYDNAKRRQNTRAQIAAQWGNLSPAFICPHCQRKGFVYTKRVARKRGISGGKATGAILTGGISLLATGLSRKEGATQAHCMNCSSTWDF